MKKMIRKLVAMLLMAAAICSLTPVYAAQFTADDYYNTNYPEYVVASKDPNGYCYLYNKPTDLDGQSINLGSYDNDTIVRLLEYEPTRGYHHVVCPDGQIGYMHTYSIVDAKTLDDRLWYRVYSLDPVGYLYMYNRPTDMNSINLGEYKDGDFLEMIDWDANEKYAYVRGDKNDQYGYVKKSSIIKASLYPPEGKYAYVKNDCYLYNRPTDMNSVNLGPHKAGETVRVVDWDSDKTFAKVQCENEDVGYIRKTSLQRLN